MRRVVTTAGLLVFALLPIVAAVSRDTVPPSRVPVAIAQPLAALDTTGPLMALQPSGAEPILPESGMLVLVGTGLLGLAAIVRRTTRNS